jgi:hypothetical protein
MLCGLRYVGGREDAGRKFDLRRFAANLGPNQLAKAILFAAQNLAPRAVALGILESNATPAVQADVQRLARDLPAAVELGIGCSGRTFAAPSASDKKAVLEDPRRRPRTDSFQLPL